MKITCATYPFRELPGGDMQRPVAGAVKQDPAVLKDVFPLSSKTSSAVLGYIQTIEQATSDIINLTGDSLEAQQGVFTAKAVDGASLEPPVTRGDTLIFLPGAHRAAGPGETPDRLVIIKGMAQPGAAGNPEASVEDVAATLMNDVARKLSRTDYRPGGLATVNADSPQVVEKFIISVDIVDDVPVPVVIRHNPWGGTVLLDKSGEPGGGVAVPDEVRKIAVFLAGLDEEEASRKDLPVTSYESRPGKTGNGKGDAGGGVVNKLDRSPWTFLLGDPAAAAKGMGQTMSRFLFGVKDLEAVASGPKGENEQDSADEGPKDSTSPVTLAGGMPGVVVKLIEGAATTGPVDDNPAQDAKIIEKVVCLVAAVNGLVETIANDVEEPANDDGTTAGARLVPAKEAVRQAVKASFQTVLSGAAGYSAGEAGKTPGITLDERGLLKLDRAALIDSLSTSKGETVRFVHDFTVSLHDRITYNACAFVGLYTGGGETVVDAPGGKEGMVGEDADRKADFEKRYKELQMLLKNSYELKESFMKGKFAGGDGQDEET